MSVEVKLTAAELAVVREILGRFLPRGYRAYVFGSRATGAGLKATSDLDLAIEGPKPLSLEQGAQLRFAFDESPLPMKVDIVDCAAIGADFARIVERTRMPL
jgi:predicted nucleotidyltransferase